MKLVANSMYIIDDSYFIDFPDSYLKGNKDANRPHYYCFKGSQPGLYWVIPMSTKIEKFKRIMQKKAEQKKPCDSIHILTIANKESAFIISDMFPITEDYITREYTINGIPLQLKNHKDIKVIDKKARKVLALLRSGHKFVPTQPDVFTIEQQLLAKLAGQQAAATVVECDENK